MARPSWAIGAVVLYVVSLALPAVALDTSHHPVFGIQCFLFGWFTVPWFANPVLLFAGIALCLDCPRLALAFALVALALALSTLCYLRVDVRELYVGFFAWLASMLALAISAGSRSPAPPTGSTQPRSS